MGNELETAFERIEQLLYSCENGTNLDLAETALTKIKNEANSPQVLAKVYGKLAQVENYRYEYVSSGEKLAVAEKGVNLAKKGLEYDENNVDANSWAAAMMGIHGMEMGILSSLFYLGPVKKHAEKALQLDESYHYGQPHIILGELYRLSPPSPVGMRNLNKALEHLRRSVELGPEDPQARFHLAELYINLRRKELAFKELETLLSQDIQVRGPVYAENWKAKAGKLREKLA